MKIRIADKIIGEGETCFIIAEAGVNHNGDMGLAIKLIDAAKECGADAVKFQSFTTENLVSDDSPKAEYQKQTTDPEESQYEMLKKLELGKEDFKTLIEHANKRGIIFLSTPYDEYNADMLEELKVSAFKVASCDITNTPLLKHIAKKGKPMIISTGMSTLEEVKDAVDVIKEESNEKIILLHCVTNYPTKLEDVNLRAMITLRDTFQLPVGYSDHTEGTVAPLAAVTLGAAIIEKHFTLNRTFPGPDHSASLEPREFKIMIQNIKKIESCLGSPIKQPTPVEKENLKTMRRSIVAKVDIPMGVIITKDMLSTKRPGTGLPPRYLNELIDKRSKVDIRKEEVITRDKIHWEIK